MTRDASGRSPQPLHRHRVAFMLGAVGACLALATLAERSAAELNGFSTPVSLSAGNAPRLAVDSEGRATVVWALRAIKASRLDAAGNPGPIRSLSKAGRVGGATVAVDPDGRATVAWTRSRPNTGRKWYVAAVRVGPTGSPGPVERLSPPQVFPSGPDVAVDPDGRATVVWAGDENGDCSNRVVQAVRLDAAGQPGPVRTLARFSEQCDSTPPAPPDVAVDAEGRATVVWEGHDGSNSGVFGVRLDATGSPGPVQALSEPFAATPRVAVDPEGTATVVWWNRRNGPVQAARIDGAGNPGPVQTISAGGFPEVAADRDGRATVVWRGRRGIRAVRFDAGGDPGPVSTLSRAGEKVETADVAVDPEGRATVVWRSGPPPRRLRAVRLDATGEAGPVQTVGNARRTDSPEVAVDAEGRATVVWKNLNRTIRAAHSLRLFDVRAKPRRRTLGPRAKRARFRVRATNRDFEAAGVVRLCAKAPARRVKIRGRRCRSFRDVGPGATVARRVRLKPLRAARGKLTAIRLIARGPDVHAQTTARLRVRR